MRCVFAVAIFLLGSTSNTWAQSKPLRISPETSRSASTLSNDQKFAVQNASYLIAPGVSVTPLYQDASTSISTYTPDQTQSSYTQEAYNPAIYTQPNYSGQTVSLGSSERYYPTSSGSITQSNQGSAQTTHYNTPHRFYMQQDGKQMKAADFDTWMERRGIRILSHKR